MPIQYQSVFVYTGSGALAPGALRTGSSEATAGVLVQD